MLFASSVFASDKDSFIWWGWIFGYTNDRGREVDGHLDDIWATTVEHLQLTAIALGVGFVLSVALAAVALRWRRTYPPIAGFAGILYAIPSLALFAILFPITGLTVLTAEIGLVGYTLLILIRNIVAGVDGVPAAVEEAADGMGYQPLKRFFAVDLRLATPAIVAGLRIASVTTVGLVTVTFVIGFGGYGGLINDGLSRDFNTPVVVGAGLSIVMALVLDLAFVIVERVLAMDPGGDLMDALDEFWHFITTVDNWWGQRGIVVRVWDHLRLSGFALVAASLLALPPAIYLGHIKRGGVAAVWLVNIGRAVPSFAIIVLVFPISLRYGLGLGFWPTAVALVLLAFPPIFTNTFTGVRDVDAGTVEAARAMGMQAREVVWSVEIPAALPLIITGLRVSAVQIVATATLGAYVGFGGLGAFIVEGFATQKDGKLLTGAILVALLSLVVELVFGRVQAWMTPWTKGDLLARRDPRAFDVVNETIVLPPVTTT